MKAILALLFMLPAGARAGLKVPQLYEATGYTCADEQGQRGRNRINDLEVLDLLEDASCSDLRGLALAGRDLSGKRLAASLFPHGLDRTIFDGSDLGGAELDEKYLDGARLNKAHLDHAHASFAHFDDAVAVGAQLYSSDFHNATFRRADLRGANFLGSDLRGAIFDGADLRGARLDTGLIGGASFAGAKFDAETVMQLLREKAEALGMIYVGD